MSILRFSDRHSIILRSFVADAGDGNPIAAMFLPLRAVVDHVQCDAMLEQGFGGDDDLVEATG